VIAYGSDATVEQLKALAGEKPFLGFGHAISIGIAFFLTKKQYSHKQGATWEDFASDILTFDQQGCLSPHAIFCHRNNNQQWLLDMLTKRAEELNVPARTNFEEAALVQSWRTIAVLQGAKVWGDDSLRWTVVEWPTSNVFSLMPCPGLVQVIPFESFTEEFLEAVQCQISCVGIAGPATERRDVLLKGFFESMGVSRICKAGEMQTPPLDWKNGGVDLEAWIANLER